MTEAVSTLSASVDRLRSPFIRTPARRNMTVLAVSAALLGLANGGLDIILPLWVTKTLHWAPTDWAMLRSARFSAVTIGVVVLGAFSDRFGQLRLTRWCSFGMGCAMALSAVCGAAALWILVPLYGILASTVFVNLNSLVQEVSTRRQGTANAIYRGFGTAAGVAAPFLVTTLAACWGQYPLVMGVLAVILFVKVMVLRFPSAESAPAPLRPLREEVRALWNSYRLALREKHLMRYIHFSLIWLNLTAAVGAFMAIRFTQELHFSDRQFGLLCSVSGVVNLSVMALSVLFMDRLPLRTVHVLIGALAGTGCLLMGANDVPVLSVTGLLLYSAMATLFLSPSSIWVSRAAGSATRTAAFSVHKVATAFYLSTAMALVGVLEQWVGMRRCLLWSGALALTGSLGFLLLREPPGPDESDRRPIAAGE